VKRDDKPKPRHQRWKRGLPRPTGARSWLVGEQRDRRYSPRVIRAARLPLLFLLALSLCAACADRSSDDSPDGAPFIVAHETRPLVDSTRPTMATAATPALPDRTLATDLYWPLAPGPFPVVVLSHGLKSHPSRFARLLEALAARGYVAVAPAYPLTNSDRPDGGDNPVDVLNQPRDLSFVVGEVLRLGGEPGDPLEGRVDPARVGLIGSSLGAITSLATAYNSCCRDQRIGAVVSISGALLGFPGTFDLSGAPLLLIHGDADDTLPYASSAQAFDQAAPPKWFITLVGGSHDVAQLGIDTAGSQQHFEQFRAILLDFLDLYLRDQPAARDRLIADAQIEGLTTLRFDAP
jgi:dienelactone hydrolase